MCLPILYSLQNCPYAIRARIGLLLAKQTVYLRAIKMNSKPSEMIEVSPKATVPVLVLNDLSVIEESLDIMIWALKKNDPSNLLYRENPEIFPEMLNIIDTIDNDFVDILKKYKCASRYHDNTEIEHRQRCEVFISMLEIRLSHNDFLMGATASLVDYAVLPFIRQFARVDRKWFVNAPYPNLQRWLSLHLNQALFTRVMAKYPLWLERREECVYP